MTVEHWIALVPSIPSVEGIMGQNQSDAIPQVLLLVVLYLHELVSEVVVMQELIVVVSQYEMLLPLQVLQDSDCGLRVVAGDVPQDEHMVRRLHYGVPVLCHPVVIVLRPIQLVVRKRQLILRSPDWIRVSLIPKVNVRNVEVVVHHLAPLVYLQFTHHKPSLSRIQPRTLGSPMHRDRTSMHTATRTIYMVVSVIKFSKLRDFIRSACGASTTTRAA